MDLTTAFQQINSAYRGSDDDAPTIGTPDGTLWLLTINRKINEWARDSKNVWQSNYSTEKPVEPGTAATATTTTLTGTGTYFTDYRVGDTVLVSGETARIISTITSDTTLTVTVAFSNTASGKTLTHTSIIASGVQSYSAHRSLLNPSDQVIVATSAQDLYYRLGKPQERRRYRDEVFLSGRFPQLITFQETISATSNIIGGTLKLPGYYIPGDLTATTDIIPVDDPMWLVYATASELAFNDLTYSDKSPDLNSKANNLYSQMVAQNRRGTSNNPRIAHTNVNRIRDTRTDMGSDESY